MILLSWEGSLLYSPIELLGQNNHDLKKQNSFKSNVILYWKISYLPVADLGFPRGRSPGGRGGTHLLFDQFFLKTA